MDERAQRVLREIRQCCLEIFPETLVGVYVHGSLALNCFNWNKSDIDFIVVVKSAPCLRQKEQFVSGLLGIDKHGPPKGLEMSLVLEKYVRDFVYPTPFELHFSNMYKQECRDNLEEYCSRMNGVDKDLSAHFTVIRNACVNVYGKPEKDVFGEIPKSDYLDSIKCDIDSAETEIESNPVHVVLNLCRVLAYVESDLILSKKDGGYWGIKNVPKKYTGIIVSALDSYLDDKRSMTDENSGLLIDFARYMHDEIFRD